MMHGVTLPPTNDFPDFCVIIADDLDTMRLVNAPPLLTAQRVITLLHEFAHFLPRYLTLQRGGSAYDTPEKETPDKENKEAGVTFQRVDVLSSDWRREGGSMFEKMLFGKYEVTATTRENAAKVMSWTGRGRLSIKTTGPSLNHHVVSQADVSNPYAHDQAPTRACHCTVRPFTTRSPLPFRTPGPTVGWAPRCEKCVGGCRAVFLSFEKHE